MVRSVVAPGSEKVLEDLFNYQQDHPHRYELALNNLTWADIVSALIRHGIGTALAYIDTNNEIICHPYPDQEIHGKGLIVLVKSSETPSVEIVEKALVNYRAFIRKWHMLQAEQAARDQAGEKPASAS
jgi:voltage-gated potassium channel